MLDAYHYVQKNGLIREVEYSPYVARQRRCDDTNGKERVYVADMIEEDEVTNDRLKELLSVQPVGVAMYSNPSCLGSYSSGIVTESECSCSAENREVNHAVTVVGYGISDRPDCQGYWLIKNSWGPYWGESGFFRLCSDKTDETPHGICWVNSFVQYPIAK